MKLRPSFYHAFFIFAFAALLASCGGSEESERLTIPKSTPAAKKGSDIPDEVNKLMTMNTCLGCHRLDKKLVGPTFKEIAVRGSEA